MKSKRILNYWHWAGVSPYTSSFDLAGTCVFVKQSLSVFCCNPRLLGGRTSPISYVQLSLQSSLRIVLLIAFVYSTRPPVSVYGTVKIVLLYGNFLENRKISTLNYHSSTLWFNQCLRTIEPSQLKNWVGSAFDYPHYFAASTRIYLIRLFPLCPPLKSLLEQLNTGILTCYPSATPDWPDLRTD